MNLQVFLILVLIGVLSGILSGIAGVGGGIVIVPLLIFLVGMSQLEAQGISLAVLLPPTGIMAVILYHKEGYINWKYAVIIAIGFLVGAFLGGKIAMKINQEILKKILGVLLLFVAIKFLIKK